jgi:hypothetical protein
MHVHTRPKLDNNPPQAFGPAQDPSPGDSVASLSAFPAALTTALFPAPFLVLNIIAIVVAEISSAFHESDLAIMGALNPAVNADVAIDEASR